jgi:hypothetical protein
VHTQTVPNLFPGIVSPAISFQVTSASTSHVPARTAVLRVSMICAVPICAQPVRRMLCGGSSSRVRGIPTTRLRTASAPSKVGCHANCNGCGIQWDTKQNARVGSFAPNPLGLYEMLGNVKQWTQDCYHGGYTGAPVDGSAWQSGRCDERVVRGAYGVDPLWWVRAAARSHGAASDRGIFDSQGFRIARAE